MDSTVSGLSARLPARTASGSELPRFPRPLRQAAVGLFLAACAFAAVAAGPARVETLTTPNYVVRIEFGCGEGVVACDSVRYLGTHRRSGKSLALRGRTLHTTCADGVTPCRFLGYAFRHGAVSYTVFESGALLVRRGERTLVEEVGSWE